MSPTFAKRTENFKSSAVRELASIISHEDVISFAGGLPNDDFFPIEFIQEAFSQVLRNGKKSLQYGLTEGFTPLRKKVTELMIKKKFDVESKDVLLTTGSQQAIDIFTRVMINPGDVILTENPTYLAALQVFRSYEAVIVPVSSDENGMLPNDLEEKIKKYAPKFIYVVPTFSNPRGTVWSLERRKSLISLAQRHNVLIFEDDPYGDIKFDENEDYTPLVSLDNGANVVYTSTFSKTVAPALRTGWATGSPKIVHMMSQCKQAADLHSSSIDQQALYYLLCNIDLDQHVAVLRREYKYRMNMMLNELESLRVPNIQYTVPKGGMFFWVELPEELNATKLLEAAVKSGVAFVPGSHFYVMNDKHNAFRLNYTYSTPEKIKSGMNRLKIVLEESYARLN